MVQSYPGGSSFMRQAFLKKGVSLEVANILLKSLSDGSIRQYNTYLKRWWNFCVTYNKDPFSEPPTEIIEFLNQEFLRGVAHSTLCGL